MRRVILVFALVLAVAHHAFGEDYPLGGQVSPGGAMPEDLKRSLFKGDSTGGKARELITRAKTLGRATVLVFTGEPCTPCNAVEVSLARIRPEISSRALVVYADVARDSDLFAQYGVSSIPSVLFLDEQGKEYSRKEGRVTKDTVLYTLKEMGVLPAGFSPSGAAR